MFSQPTLSTDLTNAKRRLSRLHLPATALLSAAFLVTGCGGGGGSSDSGASSDFSVTETLHALNIPTTEDPLVDDDGVEYPEDYSRLGPTYEMNKISELTVMGPLLYPDSSRLSLWDLEGGRDRLASYYDATAPWVSDNIPPGAAPVTRRAGMSADLDGDGREEQVFAHFDDLTMTFTIFEDAEAGYAQRDFEMFLHTGCLDVNITGADADGDGDEEIILAYSLPDQATVAIFDYDMGEVVLEPMIEHHFESRYGGNLLMLELAAGNLDHDSQAEYAVVANEYYVDLNDLWLQSDGIGCTGFILDDLMAELEPWEQLDMRIPDTTYQATVAEVDLGDLDADGIDEIVFAGCDNSVQTDAWARYVLIVRDDGNHALADMGSIFFEDLVEDSSVVFDDPVTWASVDIVDFMGDHACEVRVNEVVYTEAVVVGEDGTRRMDWDVWGELSWTYPRYVHEAWGGGQVEVVYYTGPLLRASAVGDFTGDGRQDLAIYTDTYYYANTLEVPGTGVVVWGVDEYQEFGVLTQVESSFPNADGADSSPQLIPVNVDSDSTKLRFLERAYVMTEPVVMAVLAAAPSISGIGQNVEANETEFGLAHSGGYGQEHNLTTSVGFIVGNEFKQWGNGWEVELDLKADFEQVWSASASLTQSMSYFIGGPEDSVICTVTPYDVYSYEVVMDPDELAIGEIVELSIPRSPITLQVEREHFNSVIGRDAIQIDETVLHHTIGDRRSYPTTGERDAILATTPGLVSQTAVTGATVSGSSQAGIVLANETGFSTYVGVSAEFSAETTVGTVKLGGSFGLGTGHTWSWTTGSETTYMGTVGDIYPEDHAEHAYQWGLFCHWHQMADRGEKFQVLNYWTGELGE